jgi:hypothetical protein
MRASSIDERLRRGDRGRAFEALQVSTRAVVPREVSGSGVFATTPAASIDSRGAKPPRVTGDGRRREHDVVLSILREKTSVSGGVRGTVRARRRRDHPRRLVDPETEDLSVGGVLVARSSGESRARRAERGSGEASAAVAATAS